MTHAQQNHATAQESSKAVAGKEKFDIQKTITEKIVALLESGKHKALSRWISQNKGMPVNGITNAEYKGINVLLLLVQAMDGGYSSNVWLTFKQAQSLGACVRKGEKSVMCVYYERVTKTKKNDSGDEENTSYAMCKPFWLFNVAQIDGLPEGFGLTPKVDESKVFQENAKAEILFQKSGAIIEYGFDGAWYSPKSDKIAMPSREAFTCESAFYATQAHELVHWTGHESRLKREFGKRFGSDSYAFEELVAELGAAFLGAHIELDESVIEGHANYLDSWLKVLKNDKTAIFTAAKHASAASDFLLEIMEKN